LTPLIGRPLPGRVHPVLRDRCAVCLSVMLMYCHQTAGWIKMPLGTQIGLGPGDIVLDGNPASHGKGHSSPPILRSMSIVTKWLDLSGWHLVLPRKGAQQPPHFAVHVHCDQMAGFIRMALGTPKERGTAPPPLFGPLCSCTVAHVSNC